jgi:hypothetical protein
VKILPSNQALILAGEPAGRRAGGDTFLAQASRLVTGSADLKRVTILSARPDSTVLVQADYFSAHDDFSRDDVSHRDVSHRDVSPGDVSPGDEILAVSQLPAVRTVSPNAVTLKYAASPASTESPTSSYYLKPTQLYARTQRGFEVTKPSVLDVVA